jgi:hypothetical protein
VKTLPITNPVWREIADDVTASVLTDTPFLARRVTTIPDVTVYRAVRPGSKLRCLLVRTDASVRPDRQFPLWNGLGITHLPLTIANTPSGRYVVLEQNIPGTELICEAVLDSLCTALEGVPRTGQTVPVLVRELRIWAKFFETFGHAGLSTEAQRGLFGELLMIVRTLAPHVGMEVATRSWIGPTGAEQDFQQAAVGIEVKTSTSAGTVRIASEGQLDDKGLEALFLAVVHLRSLSTGGMTLPELVAEARALADAAAGSTADLDHRLSQAGYLDAHAGQYEDGWAVQSTEIYRVAGDFPRVARSSLTPAIEKVQYTLSLNACAPYMTTLAALQATVIAHWVPEIPSANER